MLISTNQGKFRTIILIILIRSGREDQRGVCQARQAQPASAPSTSGVQIGFVNSPMCS